MAWIHTISIDKAEGALARLYQSAIKRAGRVFQIVKIQSLMHDVMQASTRLYEQVMFAPRDSITRAQREMIACAVSQVNDCYY